MISSFAYGRVPDPVAEGMPLHKLVSLSRMINIDECPLVHRAGAHLVVAGREKLDHVVPVLLIFPSFMYFQTDLPKAVSTTVCM